MSGETPDRSRAMMWAVHRTTSAKFPYRITVERGGRTLLAVRAQSSWPGPGQQIFCLREDEFDVTEHLEPVESCAVVHYKQVGRKLQVVLDRAVRKRCEFLRIEKKYRGREGSYEQIFFRTESGIHAHRSRSRLEIRPGANPLTIAVDSGERYAWNFPNASTNRRRLPAGDYALMEGGKPVAVIERKSFEGLLTDLGAVQALHHQLADLARSAHAIVIVEAQYGDFLDPRRLEGRWPASYTSRAIAELIAMHPTLPIVFAGNRKLANALAIQFFQACLAREESPQLSLVAETEGTYEAIPIEQQIRDAVIAWDDGAFSTPEIAARFPDVRGVRVRRVLDQLEAEGMLTRQGRGRGLRWMRGTNIPSRE
jgi:hypothetical protein